MSAAPDISWSEANQQLLAAEFERLRTALEGTSCEATTSAVRQAAARMPSPSAIDTLTSLFSLTPFERDLLLLACGVEMDSRLASAVASAGRDGSRPWVTAELALGALPHAHWSALAPVAPLRQWQLLILEEQGGLAQAALRADERIVHYLAGVNYLDPRLQSLCSPVPAPTLMSERHQRASDTMLQTLRRTERAAPVVHLRGGDRDGQRDVAVTLTSKLGARLFSLSASDLPADSFEQRHLATLWQREAGLLGAALLILGAEGAGSRTAARFASRLEGVTFMTGELAGDDLQRRILSVTIDHPTPPEQQRLWQEALGPHALADAVDVDAVACQQRLSARRIDEIAHRLSGPHETPQGTRLRQLCQEARGPLPSGTQAVSSPATWDALVLPPAQHRTLEHLLISVRQRLRVHHEWGFARKGSRGLGLASLFWGDSGTGKTLAAEVLANEVALPLYRIDLSAVVSKYIGETEKHLRVIFDAAEEAGAILLFDEADALFGRRSEVKDSHDRYANIEVSYLLQRMEAYDGLAILTTNQKDALDKAFLRRLRFVVHFPFPDATQREAIWRTAFPPATPLNGVDFSLLARLNVTGGAIHNIALTAAFLAADSGEGAVTMAHLLQAARLESTKRETTLSEAQVRGWV